MTNVRRTVLSAVLAASLGLAAVGCASTPADPETTASAVTDLTLNLGQSFEPTSFDPATAQEGHQIPYFQAVYDTLIKMEPDGTLAPMLATAWKYNEGQTTLTLTLRNDVKFTDGSAFNAEVVKANLEHFKLANGPQASNLKAVQSVVAVDKNTVTVNLSAPDPALLLSLTNAPGMMASADALGTDGIISTPVGSGPYTLDKADTVVGSQYVYQRNDKYWGDPLPYKEIHFLILGDETARLNALKSGQINAAPFTQVANVLDGKAAGFQLLQQQTDWQGISFFDRDGVSEKAIGDVRVRQALIYAIDRKGILNKILQGQGDLTGQIFRPSALGFDKAYENAYPFNPAKARKLLKEAGYGDGLTVGLPTSPAFDPAIYTTIEQQWKDVGVSTIRTDYGPGQQLAAIVAGKHALAYSTLNERLDWQQMQLYLTPTSIYNPFHVDDPKVTGLISDFQAATTDGQRKTIAHDINKYIVEQAWFAPFYRPYQNYLADDSVKIEMQSGQAVPSIYNYTPAQ